ncbi:hypothetical protein AB0K15_28955 [Amycolatopsis sp. NPDC049253]|uniref:hypothetical protein n=1 Tax=Amycolatopsis sp. NPDC049253 TaxID=3155274 RepID=UPI00343B23B1
MALDNHQVNGLFRMPGFLVMSRSSPDRRMSAILTDQDHCGERRISAARSRIVKQTTIRFGPARRVLRIRAAVWPTYSPDPRLRACLIWVAVLGDTAEDFALANLLHLTYGRCVWLPPFLGTRDEELGDPLSAGLHDLATRTTGRPRGLTLTSMSLPRQDLDHFQERLLSAQRALGFNRAPAETWSVPAAELTWPRTNTTQLAVSEQFDDMLTVPTIGDETGTREMVTPLPPPAIDDPALAAHSELSWHVDVTWTPSNSVLGRGVLGNELFASATSLSLTLARNTRSGISHQSGRQDFVASGIQAINRIARPALRDLSLTGFVAAKAAEHGVTMRISDAGQRTAQLARMLGGRASFTELFGGSLLPALHSLLPTSTSNDTAYPDHDGVVLRAREGVLSFPGICARALGMDPPEVRHQIDSALRAGVLRRGLVLRCQTCQSKQFQTSINLVNAGTASSATPRTTSITRRGTNRLTNRLGFTGCTQSRSTS